MPAIQTLLDKRASAWAQMTALLDTADAEGRDLTAEEVQSYDRAEAEVDATTQSIERQERHDKRSQQFDGDSRDGDDTPEHRDDEPSGEKRYESAFVNYMLHGIGELDNDERKILRSGWQPEDKEGRAQSVGTTTAGGYLVPQGFRQRIIETMKDYGAVQRVAEVITTDSGQALPWPTNNDTGNVGALLAENTQVAEQDIVLGQAQLDAYKYTSKLTRVSLELIQDSAFSIEDFIVRKHGERLGRILNQHFTTGTGSSQPNGIVTAAVSGVTAASATAITADELIDLIHSVDPAYRASPRARFMFSDTALKAFRKLKASGSGEYLWQPSVQAGVAASLFGYPYEINQDMAVPATGVKSVLFGDFFAGYVIRIVRAFQSVRFDERYMDFFQLAYVTFTRADAEAQDTGAYKALTQA